MRDGYGEAGGRDTRPRTPATHLEWLGSKQPASHRAFEASSILLLLLLLLLSILSIWQGKLGSVGYLLWGSWCS